MDRQAVQQMNQLEQMSQADQREVYQVMMNESQKAQIHQMVHHLSNLCWKKCITGKMNSGSLDKTEEACAQNCVDRYMDSNVAVFKHLQTMRGGQ